MPAALRSPVGEAQLTTMASGFDQPDVAAGQQTPQGQGTIGSLVQVMVDDSLESEDSGLLTPVTQPDRRL